MWTKEYMMKLPQEKLPEIGSDKIYNDVIKIEDDWDNNEETKPITYLLNTSIRNEAEKYWQTIDELQLESQMEQVNFIKDIREKFLKQEQ